MGEDHNPETHIIPFAIKAALENGEFYLYGTDYSTPDGTCVRDYIHVLDLVEAHLLSLSKLQKETGGFFYNVGTGVGFSNKQVVEMVKKVSGIDFKLMNKETRTSDPDILVTAVPKIQKHV